MPAEITILDASGVNILTPNASFFNSLDKRLLEFLRLVEQDFPTPLSLKVNLDEYVKKIMHNACIGIILDASSEIIGYIIFYCNDMMTLKSYCSVFAVHPMSRGNKLGNALLNFWIDTVKKFQFSTALIHSENPIAFQYLKKTWFSNNK